MDVGTIFCPCSCMNCRTWFRGTHTASLYSSDMDTELIKNAGFNDVWTRQQTSYTPPLMS